ncbi:MFS transporter [Thermodesulfobacteriota bacterium]
MTLNELNKTYYRWYILFLGMMAYFFIAGLPRMCMPVLFKEISEDIGLSIVKIGWIWGMDPLAGVFIALPGGLIADRFGVKRTMVLISIIAGIFGALRGLSVNFVSMAVTMFLFGLTAATMPSVVPKLTAQWFRGRELGITNALLNIIWGFGSMSATMFSATLFSPFFGGWRVVMFVYGIPCIILAFLWLFTGREPKPEDHSVSRLADSVSLRDSLIHIIKIKEVWIIGLITFTFWGSSNGMVGYLPVYLRDIGWTPVAADSVITVMAGVATIGAIPVVILSDRLGTRKGVMLVSTFLMASTLFFLPVFQGSILWLLIIINGFTRIGVAALFNVVVIELKEVGSVYSGSTVGLVSAMGMLGAFLSPPLGNYFANYNAGYPFFFWAILASAGLPLFLLLRKIK